jgi:hypothetical protein
MNVVPFLHRVDTFPLVERQPGGGEDTLTRNRARLDPCLTPRGSTRSPVVVSGDRIARTCPLNMFGWQVWETLLSGLCGGAVIGPNGGHSARESCERRLKELARVNASYVKA